MINRFKVALFLAVFSCICGFYVSVANATTSSESVTEEITQSERVSLAKQFLARMRAGFAKAENFLSPQASGFQGADPVENILPEGEQLLFQVFLPKQLRLDNVIFGSVENQEIVLSLKDFVSTLELPIAVNAESQIAQGWYIRENNLFKLDLQTGSVNSAAGEFQASDSITVADNDILVPISELETWFDFEIFTKVSELKLVVKSAETLPIQERIERLKKEHQFRKVPEPEKPLAHQPKQLIDVPFVDIATNSSYNRRGNTGITDTRHTANIRTAGDFAYGTLTTQTQITDEDQISNIRANYKQESLEPNLLGPLKAKRFEVGDVIQPRLPIDSQVRQELGARITNADPLRNLTTPLTAITGTIYPDWDVELYRGSQFLGFQRVGDDGFYAFNDVVLFDDENVFKLIFYGPQGEVREEEVSIPVDLSNLAEGAGVYDVSLTFDAKQTYRKNDLNDEDEGTPTLLALYEKPLAAGTVGSLGFRSNEQNGERNNVGYAGISKVFGETLLNANAAIDDEADFATELGLRRNFGQHDVVSTTRYFSDNYDTVFAGNDSEGFFDTRFNADGPLPLGIGQNPKYSAALGYARTNPGISTTTGSLGFNTRYKNFTFNEQLNYTKTNAGADDRLISVTSLNAPIGRDRLRLRSNYEIKPDSQLQSVLAEYQHDFTKNLELNLSLERVLDPTSITEAEAQLNWLAGWGRISPSIRYNTENDFFVGLNTNFGLARDPQDTGIKSFDRNLTSNGGISALVFLDENGDGLMNVGENPIEGVVVRALQNGGREKTNENGVALFTRVRELKLTDVVVEEETLEDPFWVPGFEGASILPREGYVAELQFPIHIASEMDGTLYARSYGEKPRALKNVPVHLYNADGEIEQTATTDLGGFYLFTRVPPGRYLLLVDHESAQNNNFARPKPQRIEFGYEGEIIYGNDIFVEAGQEDVPSTILSDLEDYKALHPHIDFQNTDYNIALNLGEYNSRLLMSTVWYRLHSRYRSILSGGQLIVLPQHSFADPKTGKHTLRVGLHNGDLDDAYNRCNALIARDIACKVEVFPANDQKFAMR